MSLGHRFETEGAGAPILMLNGGMMSYAGWEPVAASLRGRHPLLFCDLRGQLSSPGPAPLDLAVHVDDLTALLDQLDLDRVHLLTTSFGAAVGLLMAARAPRRVLSLAAVTATARATEAIAQGAHDLRRVLAEARRGGDLGRFHDRLAAEVYSESYRRQHRAELAERRRQVAALPEVWFEGVEGILASIEQLDLTDQLDRIHCPVLVVIAADDRTIPPRSSRALATALRDAEVVEHPTSGHALVAEEPQWLARHYLEFLAKVGP